MQPFDYKVDKINKEKLLKRTNRLYNEIEDSIDWNDVIINVTDTVRYLNQLLAIIMPNKENKD